MDELNNAEELLADPANDLAAPGYDGPEEPIEANRYCDGEDTCFVLGYN